MNARHSLFQGLFVATVLGMGFGWSFLNAEEKTEPKAGKEVAESQSTLANLMKELDASETALKGISSYTTTFVKQEEVAGKLQDEEVIAMKVRNQPFGAYMKWEKDGQQVLFVEGQNENKLLVKSSGLLGLVGTIKLEPTSKEAMETSRYPVTEAGLMRLVTRIKKFYEPFHSHPEGVKCTYSQKESKGVPVDVYEMVFQNPKQSPDYQSSRLTFDQKTKILVSVENFGWSKKEGQEAPLVERYQFRELNFSANLTDSDFDPKNQNYAF